MTAFTAPVAEQADAAHNLEARHVGRHDEHRRAAMGRGERIGHSHDDHEGCVVRAGGEPFVSVEYPIIAIADCGGSEICRVGTPLRLGHRVAREDILREVRA